MNYVFRNTPLVLFTAAMVSWCGSTANAGEITGISAMGPGMTLTSSSFTNAISGPMVLNTATLNFSVNSRSQLLQPTNLLFALRNTLAPPGFGQESLAYAVTVNVTNNLIISIPGFDVIDGPGSGGHDGIFTLGSTPSTNLTLQNTSFPFTNIPGPPAGWRFGGLNGGGIAIDPGQTKTATFSYQLLFPEAGFGLINGTAGLTFVANPEPTTFLLGALVLVPGIVIARRRRRKSEISDAAIV